jgi:hypothetical protein
MSSSASSIDLHIACHFTRAISISVAISSEDFTTFNESAVFAADINFVSATVHFEAFLIASSISSLAIHADSESLSNDL